jgi:protein-disulfide isomerase-like protein with CxxC motif
MSQKSSLIQDASFASGALTGNKALLGEIAHAHGVDADALEIWFADEARVSQKNKITRRWAKLLKVPRA